MPGVMDRLGLSGPGINQYRLQTGGDRSVLEGMARPGLDVTGLGPSLQLVVR